jgi:hypothetical protein
MEWYAFVLKKKSFSICKVYIVKIPSLRLELPPPRATWAATPGAGARGPRLRPPLPVAARGASGNPRGPQGRRRRGIPLDGGAPGAVELRGVPPSALTSAAG